MWKVLKTKKLEIYWRQKKKKRRNKIQGCRGQNHAGEVSKFKFRSLSLIWALLHLSSISGRSSKQKNSKFIEGRSKKKRRNKKQGCRGQNHAGEVSKLKFRCLSLICAVLHLSSISGRSSKQKNSKSVKAGVMIMTIFGAHSVGLSCVAPFERQNTNLETSYEG